MREFHILNLGAGVQSTCLYLLSREPESKIHFDVAIFADTGEEPESVYNHLKWLQTLETPKILIKTVGDRLGDDLMYGYKKNGRWSTSIPAFTSKEGGDYNMLRFCANKEQPKPTKVGLLSRQCTNKYKIKVVVMSIKRDVLNLKPKQRIPKDAKIFQYFGITTDERQRAKASFPETPWSTPVYPFLEMNWSREDCIKWLKDKVPHEVPRSACVFCPYKNNTEWLNLKKNDAEGWKRAVEIDNGIRNMESPITNGLKQKLFLHRSCIPLEMIDFETEPTLFRPMVNECQGMCGV